MCNIYGLLGVKMVLCVFKDKIGIELGLDRKVFNELD